MGFFNKSPKEKFMSMYFDFYIYASKCLKGIPEEEITVKQLNDLIEIWFCENEGER